MVSLEQRSWLRANEIARRLRGNSPLPFHPKLLDLSHVSWQKCVAHQSSDHTLTALWVALIKVAL